MKRPAWLVLLAAHLLITADARAITIPTVPVGNAGNAGDTQVMSTDGTTGYGAVAYNYRIGTTEVTVSQYAAFLNAVGGADTYGLYNTNMGTDLAIAGIARSGSSGSYSYSVMGSPDKPIAYVTWGDAARFANWLHNGQPSGPQNAGTTENGAYTLNGATTSAALNNVSRNSGATWFIPSENEWYKAAYHKNDGVTGNYWDYATSTDLTPYSDQPPGSDAPTQSNTANFWANDELPNGYNDGHAATGVVHFQGFVNHLTDAGAYALSVSPYGTYDQGGNVNEWNETIIVGRRGMRGGRWGGESYLMLSAYRSLEFASFENAAIGFRVANVPEPSTLALAALGAAALLAIRKCQSVTLTVLLLGTALLSSRPAWAVTIPTVPVGNAGNAGDTEVMDDGTTGYGSVTYNYRIGTTEVTNAQYAEFLNAKASSDPLGLYGAWQNAPFAGISRSGSGTFVDPYVYAVNPNMGNKPVISVNWFSAVRFTNWLHNGQGNGDTETGAYTLGALNPDGTPIDSVSIARNTDAVWFLPSENEWYKAAYYDPSLNGGSGGYWDFPTRSDSEPTLATASSVGDIDNPGANVANYDDGTSWGGFGHRVTTVGSAGRLSASYYGTLDQGGNAAEWTETRYAVLNPLREDRVQRGGSVYLGSYTLQSNAQIILAPSNDVYNYGFRVAMVPEPSTFVLAAIGLLGVSAYARRRLRRASGV
jgi:formylglycine-generating enzyme required for sulfatase activity